MSDFFVSLPCVMAGIIVLGVVLGVIVERVRWWQGWGDE